MEKKFYWNPETLDAFRFEANYMTPAELLNSVEVFVENECALEDGETEEMLIHDLLNQISPNAGYTAITKITRTPNDNI